MSSSIQTVLKERFGFDTLRTGQQSVIECLLADRSAAAVFPTGGGKSLCYQLPALLVPGLTVVVSPLIALMKDQIDALTARGIAASRLDSTLNADEYRSVSDRVRQGSLKLLYVAPERFNNERFREMLRHVPIALFAVDEAHCISEWGHNFRPDYLKLARYAREFNAQRVLALTATATPRVLDDICRSFQIDNECAVHTGFYRANLTIKTQVVRAEERNAALLQAINENPAGPAIVYVTLQHTAETTAQWLAANGLPARAYHAGLKDEIRTQVQEWFMTSNRAIVVATIAFGMGVDKANIRAVYHYNPPKSLENYSQEIGRAGRDNQPSICQMFYCPDDLNVLENFVYGDTPDEAAIVDLLEALFAQEERFDINQYALSSDHDIRPLVLKTLLVYLELAGYIEGGTPLYSDYKFKPLKPSAEILARFEGERRQFLAALFRQATRGRTWFGIDPDRAARQLATERERIVRTMDWLGEQRFLEVKAAGVRHRYHRLRQPNSIIELATELHKHFIRREAAEIARLQQVVDLVSLDGCQTNALASHFGENRSQPCGHCSWCEGGQTTMAARPHKEIDESLWRKVTALVPESRELIDTPRLLTRFLCGITSPLISRNKLTAHALFASLEDFPFQQVMQRAERDMETDSSAAGSRAPDAG